jgi:hypothetical protein
VTDPDGPYAGPPPTGPPAWPPPLPPSPPPGYGWAPPPGYGYGYGYGYPPPGYGYAPPPWGPPAPRRPGPVTAAAVLSFVQFGLVLIGTLYLLLVALIAGTVAGLPDAELPERFSGLAVEGVVLAVVQLAADVLLLVAAIRAMSHRSAGTWRLLVAALAAHVVLAGYWFVRLLVLRGEVPGDAADALAALTPYTVLFAVIPLVALGLVVLGSGRRWFEPGRGRG